LCGLGQSGTPEYFGTQSTAILPRKTVIMDPLLIRDKDDVVIASFTQVKLLEQAAIRQIGEAFKDLTLQAASGRKLLLDFSRVEFMSSAMIGEIVRLQKQCKQDKIKLKLCCISPNIREVFQITGLNKLLEIYPDGARAFTAFGPPSPGWNR
jgi:anti-sigma B factor antagonist